MRPPSLSVFTTNSAVSRIVFVTSVSGEGERGPGGAAGRARGAAGALSGCLYVTVLFSRGLIALKICVCGSHCCPALFLRVLRPRRRRRHRDAPPATLRRRGSGRGGSRSPASRRRFRREAAGDGGGSDGGGGVSGERGGSRSLPVPPGPRRGLPRRRGEAGPGAAASRPGPRGQGGLLAAPAGVRPSAAPREPGLASGTAGVPVGEWSRLLKRSRCPGPLAGSGRAGAGWSSRSRRREQRGAGAGAGKKRGAR